MRFITLSAVFLAASTTLAAPLDLYSRHEDDYPSLVLRDDVAYTGGAIGITARSDLYEENWLESRSAKSKANTAARKERKANAKAEVAQAKQKGENQQNKAQGKKTSATPAGKAAAEAAGKTAAQDKKTQQKADAQARHQQLKAAGAEHKKTTGLPDRKDTFTVPAGNGKPERTYTGKDVRKANFGSQIKNSSGNRFGKQFGNSDHIDPGTSGTTKPIPGMTGPGHEHPLSPATTPSQMKKDHKNEPARIISQTDAAGNHQHKGVIAHDQSRPATHAGANDHFKINPVPNPRPQPLQGVAGTILG